MWGFEISASLTILSCSCLSERRGKIEISKGYAFDWNIPKSRYFTLTEKESKIKKSAEGEIKHMLDMTLKVIYRHLPFMTFTDILAYQGMQFYSTLQHRNVNTSLERAQVNSVKLFIFWKASLVNIL